MQIPEVPLRIATLLILGFLIRWLVFRAIDRLTTRASSGFGTSKGLLGHRRPGRFFATSGRTDERQVQRAQALGSLFKSLVTGTLGLIVCAMILEELGFSLGPFLASAGVAGVALGFGAQNLVKDVVSGAFMLLEDQFGVGDVIDMSMATGTVEAVGLRITKVRDADGVLWHIRNGEVLRVGNMSMGWSALTLDIDVAYDEDVERVQAVIDEVGQALAADEAWQDKLLETPKAMGVQGVTGTAVTVRILGQCKPSQRDGVARELRRRVKAAFDDEGLRLPAT